VEELPIETTVYSISGEPPPEQDRRSDERHLTLFRVGTIVTADRRELCLVKNISAGGVLIRAYCKLDPDMAVQVELKEGQPAAGRVSWIRGTDAGITFDKRVDVIALLKASGDGPRPRMPRIEVKCIGFVREGAIVHRALIRNVSQGGVSVEVAKPLTIGADVTVSLPDLAPQSAIVRWNEDGRFGIGFNSVLPLADLVAWLHSRQGL